MDWCREVEEYLWKGYDDNRVKDAMLSSVEGQAYVNFHPCDEGRNRTPAQILREMDSIYNVSVTFRDLNAQMCGLKQGMNEPIKSYYKRMVDISVKLEQYHGDHFGPGELSLMKKDCFYAGLKENNKYLVSHMKEMGRRKCWGRYGSRRIPVIRQTLCQSLITRITITRMQTITVEKAQHTTRHERMP